MSKLTKDEVIKIAKLAKLDLTEQEINKYQDQLSNILEFVEQLNEIDTSDKNIVSNIDDFVGSTMREDIADDSMDSQKVLLNATNNRSKDNYFATSKII
jgi:aspartyl-tRNA(Asn)/glutamyl-tRNA(Gln) amidotransferase subunit C